MLLLLLACNAATGGAHKATASTTESVTLRELDVEYNGSGLK